WGYDAYGYNQAAECERVRSEAPETAADNWRSYQAWHPPRHLTRVSPAEAEEARLRDLGRDAHRLQREARLAELRQRATDPDADPRATWEQFQSFHASFQEADVEGDLQELRSAIKARRDYDVAGPAHGACDELVTAESRAADMAALVEQADGFLRDYAGSPHERDVRVRREAYLGRLDERVIEVARAYSAKNPLNFQTRREHYQRYLDKYPTGAAAVEATTALQAMERQWDKHDFRAVRAHFLSKPGDIAELVARCRTSLAVHPHGAFTSAATELLRWSERVTAPGEYTVTVRDGHFERK